MPDRSYWLDLFTGTTWEEFVGAGAEVSGFRESRWTTVQRIKPGDYLLCYLTGVSRFVGVVEVTSAAYRDTTPIWKDEAFPCRLHVRRVVALSPETAVPVLDLRDQLSIFKGLKNPNYWSGAFRGSPARWKSEDGEAVTQALLEASVNPVERPVDRQRLNRRPAGYKSRAGTVVVPPDDDEDSGVSDEISEQPAEQEPTIHTEIQWLLLKLGTDMGMNVWAARGDRNREWNGRRFDSLTLWLRELPHQFDQATNRIVEQIDVLWLRNNAFTAAFEIESTTSIYSGLLRMSDLVAMQPNLKIPLFIVAPDERRAKVIREVNRPTFSVALETKLADICRYISFVALRDHIAQARPYLKYLTPEFLQEISESCEADELE